MVMFVGMSKVLINFLFVQIVSLGMPSVSPNERVGTYVSPNDWNSLISDPDTVAIDVCNDYKTRIGKFKGAVDPRTTVFREFPLWVDDEFQVSPSNAQVECRGSSNEAKKQNEEGEKSPPRVAMYCIGGIRCEKASSFLLSKGFKEYILYYYLGMISLLIYNHDRGGNFNLFTRDK